MNRRERDLQIAKLKAEGVLTHQEISKRVGCGINTVNNVLRQSEIQALIAKLQTESTNSEIDNFHQDMNDASIHAFQTLSWLAQQPE